ncbi:MAG: LytTR family transcriptional regulator [Saprospiraceae bacterium]|nr:LytTR family transcriptional regulator [Saprospiraceae bacterium]
MQLIKTKKAVHQDYPNDLDIQAALSIISTLQKEIERHNQHTGVDRNMVTIHAGKVHIMVRMTDILYIEAQSNYTTVYIRNKNAILVSKTLKYWENTLDKNLFIRCHRSYLVNRHEIKMYDRKERIVELSNNVNVVANKKFCNQIEKY